MRVVGCVGVVGCVRMVGCVLVGGEGVSKGGGGNGKILERIR